MKLKIYAAILILLLSVSATIFYLSRDRSTGWLLDAHSDTQRFFLLQRYLRGFDQPMWEVGERFNALHSALQRNNFELAAYHWDKIRATIKNGYMKKPKYQSNSDAMFLNTVWEPMREAIVGADSARAWASFEQVKGACMACHQAEGMGFMNNQPVFDLSAPKP